MLTTLGRCFIDSFSTGPNTVLQTMFYSTFVTFLKICFYKTLVFTFCIVVMNVFYISDYHSREFAVRTHSYPPGPRLLSQPKRSLPLGRYQIIVLGDRGTEV